MFHLSEAKTTTTTTTTTSKTTAAATAATLLVSDVTCTPSCTRRDQGCSYQVAWSINPHMRVGAVNANFAIAEHALFLKALKQVGASTQSLPFIHGAFDCVFSKDNAIIVERPDGAREALMTRPRHNVRSQEQQSRAEALVQQGIHVRGASRFPLEGGDVVMLPGADAAFLGHGFRSSAKAACDVERFLDGAVTCLQLCEPHLYHLDMVLSVLDDGTALVCCDALMPEAMRAIERHPLITDVICVPCGEALHFGVNLVQVGSSIVWAADAPMTKRALEARGYRVITVPLQQFHYAGGSAACLVSRVHRQAETLSSSSTNELAPQSTAA